MKNWKCAMDKLVSLADLHQYFLGALILYKEKPTKVTGINENKVFKLFDLETQKTSQVSDPYGHITPPNRRIGMVNIGGNVIYVKRIPMRRYQIGISSQNTQSNTVRGCEAQDGEMSAGDAREYIRNMNRRELADAMFNKYPTLKEARAAVKEFPGGMAFDKQFAVNWKGQIFYRESLVGNMPDPKSVKAKDIIWNPGCEYLSILLDGNHEKDLRTVATTCRKS